ncbi:hypothetical protein SLEP1_g3174 [Rubroshorea leprosula]|uniref:RING-type domain-containing protein n=1 Tax=Rubroshorea leprosula TaxID=152421 RepID=A0AAV5HSS4_9ROSI|nr:hypothetical protein SLEP1_g3174 [Rubroshorea leprosula]
MQKSYEPTDDRIKNRSSPTLVPVPIHFLAESVKEQLTVSEYRYFVPKRLGEEEESLCIVCMGCIEASDEVREISSCHHVFHRKCLDGWIDHGHIICPLCKSKPLATRDGEGSGGKGEGDPWRRERMVYLFGEDCNFNTSN